MREVRRGGSWRELRSLIESPHSLKLFQGGAVDAAQKLQVEVKYESLRSAARDTTTFKLRLGRIGEMVSTNFDKLDLTHISDRALADAAKWNFPWRRIVGQTRPYLRRFEVAFWQEGKLLGLAIGRASRGSDNVTVHYLERLQEDNPIRSYVALLVADTAENYAKLLGRQRVKLKNPTEALIKKYEILGFSLAETYRGVTYYERRVRP
jgi:hypothetical protein